MTVHEVDVRELECPKAVAKAMRKLAEARVGDVVIVVSNSRDCVKSLASSVVRLGIGTVSLSKEGDSYVLRIVKSSQTATPSDYAC